MSGESVNVILGHLMALVFAFSVGMTTHRIVPDWDVAFNVGVSAFLLALILIFWTRDND